MAKVCRRLESSGRGLLADRAHNRNEVSLEFFKQLVGGRRGHSLVRVVNVRVGDVLVGRKVRGILSAELECPFEIGHHRREVVGRPRPRPCIVGGGAVCDGARDMVGRYLDLLLIFTVCDTDQARVVGIVWQLAP